MNIGFAERSPIQELRKNDEIRNSDVAAFLSESTKFIITILKKLFEKSPAGFIVVKNASIFNPHTLRNEKVAVVQRRLNLLLSHLEKQKILSTAQCDKMTEQFLEFIDYNLKVNIVKCENFSANDTNFDDFYFRFIGIEKYKELSFSVKIVLTLSHGQTSVERSFTPNKSVLNHNIIEDSIVAKKAIRNRMLSTGLESQSIVISNKLVRCVSGACQKYQDYLVQHKDEEKQLTIDQPKSTSLKEIFEVSSKRDQLDKIYASLEADYVKFIEMTKSLSYVSKANALKRKAVYVKNDLKRWKKC